MLVIFINFPFNISNIQVEEQFPRYFLKKTTTVRSLFIILIRLQWVRIL